MKPVRNPSAVNAILFALDVVKANEMEDFLVAWANGNISAWRDSYKKWYRSNDRLAGHLNLAEWKDTEI